jgi:hypothetical protein
MLRAYLLAYHHRIASFSGLGRIACWFCQTFDAVDGKQARRTNSSSPLGELFDHGNSLIFSCIDCVWDCSQGFTCKVELLLGSCHVVKFFNVWFAFLYSDLFFLHAHSN